MIEKKETNGKRKSSCKEKKGGDREKVSDKKRGRREVNDREKEEEKM